MKCWLDEAAAGCEWGQADPALFKKLGLREVNQVGSHVILVTDSPVHHRIPVPRHKTLGTGLFKTIVGEVCRVKGVTQETLLRNL